MFSSPTPSLVSSAESASENYLGSATNPWTVLANVDYPERNLIFDIVHVKRIEYGGWAREGIDIRTEVGLTDVHHWSAWMEQNCEAEYKGRAVIIRGKSRSSTYDEVESYHRNGKFADLKAIHKQTTEKLKKNPARQSVYYRLILPFEVDNVILSGDPVEILKNRTGIVYMLDSTLESRAMFVN